MLRYLHTLAQGFTSRLAARMVQHRDYVLIRPPTGDSTSFTHVWDSVGVKLGAWHIISWDLANKTRLITPSDACNYST